MSASNRTPLTQDEIQKLQLFKLLLTDETYKEAILAYAARQSSHGYTSKRLVATHRAAIDGILNSERLDLSDAATALSAVYYAASNTSAGIPQDLVPEYSLIEKVKTIFIERVRAEANEIAANGGETL